jgi:hypothetical protein
MAKITPQSAVRKHEQRMHPGKEPSFAKGGSVSAPDAGYPQTGIKTSGVKMRGAGAATKGTMCRGPMA